MYLEQISGPDDIKQLKPEELKVLAEETRNALISRLSRIGGHAGSNLGVVELTVALHYVFHSLYSLLSSYNHYSNISNRIYHKHLLD